MKFKLKPTLYIALASTLILAPTLTATLITITNQNTRSTSHDNAFNYVLDNSVKKLVRLKLITQNDQLH